MRLIPGGVKIWKRDFEMQIKGPNFAKWFTNVRNAFPEHLSDTVG